MMHEVRLVRDLMKVGVPRCALDTPIDEIARHLLENDLEALIVLDSEGHAAGVVSREELVRAYTRDDCRTLTAEAVMSERVLEVPPDIPLSAAVQIMLDNRVRTVFLMHHAEGIQYPAAMLSFTHILRHLAAEDAEDLRDLGIRAERESPLAAFIKRRDEAKRRRMSPDES